MNFRDYLKSRGFKPYRKKYINKEWCYTECKREYEFSTIADGMIDVRYKKDDVEITFGLQDVGYGSTIISPKRNAIDRPQWDRFIWSKTNKELYEYLTS